MNEVIDFINNIPYFWLIFSIVVFKFFVELKKVKLFSKVPPIIFASALIIFLLIIFKIDYEEYNKSADILTFMLFPAIVALAYPLVENFNLIKTNKRAVTIGVLMATVVNTVTVVVVAHILHANEVIILSLVPKSVTTPIAIEVSKNIGGIPELTACVVVLTGILGGLLGHRVLSLFKIKHNFSIGLAIGAASHALGTSRCVEKKEPAQAAISGLTLVLVAICTAILAPVLLGILL